MKKKQNNQLTGCLNLNDPNKKNEPMTHRVTSSVTEILGKEYGVGELIPFEKFAEDLDIAPGMLARLMEAGHFGYPFCLKLAKYFGTTPEYWLNIQREWEKTYYTSNKDFQASLERVKPFVLNV